MCREPRAAGPGASRSRRHCRPSGDRRAPPFARSVSLSRSIGQRRCEARRGRGAGAAAGRARDGSVRTEARVRPRSLGSRRSARSRSLRTREAVCAATAACGRGRRRGTSSGMDRRQVDRVSADDGGGRARGWSGGRSRRTTSCSRRGGEAADDLVVDTAAGRSRRWRRTRAMSAGDLASGSRRGSRVARANRRGNEMITPRSSARSTPGAVARRSAVGGRDWLVAADRGGALGGRFLDAASVTPPVLDLRPPRPAVGEDEVERDERARRQRPSSRGDLAIGARSAAGGPWSARALTTVSCVARAGAGGRERVRCGTVRRR